MGVHFLQMRCMPLYVLCCRMNYTIRPKMRYVFAMAVAVSILALVLVAIMLPIAMCITSPGEFQPLPPLSHVFYFLAIGLPVGLLPALFCVYLFERPGSWTVTQVGIEIRRGSRLVRQISWLEIQSVRLARFTVSIRAVHRPFIHRLTFVDRNELLPHIPESKRYFVMKL